MSVDYLPQPGRHEANCFIPRDCFPPARRTHERIGHSIWTTRNRRRNDAAVPHGGANRVKFLERQWCIQKRGRENASERTADEHACQCAGREPSAQSLDYLPDRHTQIDFVETRPLEEGVQ
jgi:hypothetical protein